MKPRFLLSGYYGFGNLGDEALLGIIVAVLRRRHAGCEIEVLSGDPAGTARAYGVDGTARFDPAAVLRAIRAADIVVSGGGGLLQNATSLGSLLYYAGIIATAVRAGKPTMIFAQSIGPLDAAGKILVRVLCAGLARATVRDERSRLLLQPLVPGVKVERTADPVFLLAPGETPLDLAAEGLAGSDPLVVISVRRWQGADRTAAALATAVDRLADAHGARIAFMPLGGAPDAEASTVVIRRCRSNPVLLPSYSLAQAAQVIAHARLVVGMRLHALIIAARLGVAFTALPYDPKVSALLEELRYPLEPLFVPGAAVPPSEEIESRIDAVWSRREELAAHLRAIAPDVERLAERNFDVLDELAVKAPKDRQA